MSDYKRIDSLDEQGRKLSAAFAEAESRETGRRRFGWRVLVPVAAVATCALALVVGLSSGDGGGLTLDEAVAVVSKAAFDQPLATSDKPLYVKSRFTAEIDGEGVQKNWNVEESWNTGGDDGMLRFWTGHASGACPDGVIQKGGGVVPIVPPGPFDTLWRGAESIDDPAGLYRAIRDNQTGHYMIGGDDGRPDPDLTVWNTVIFALDGRGPYLTPRQRSVLIESLGEIPGVKTLGRTADPNGVAAIGFTRSFHDSHLRVFFDVKTGLTTFSEATTLPYFGDIPATKKVTTRSELLDYRYVSSLPDLEENADKVPAECVGHYFTSPPLDESKVPEPPTK